jgi:hypothetical protein
MWYGKKMRAMKGNVILVCLIWIVGITAKCLEQSGKTVTFLSLTKLTSQGVSSLATYVLIRYINAFALTSTSCTPWAPSYTLWGFAWVFTMYPSSLLISLSSVS